MPFYTPPGMANSLYLAMLRQQQQDIDNQQSRFDVQEDRRLNSMHKIAELQLRKKAQEQDHMRQMEQLALQKQAQYQQSVMEQQAAGQREQMKQGVRVGIEEMKEGGRGQRHEGTMGLGYAQLGLGYDKLNQRKIMDAWRQKLIKAKTQMVQGIGRDRLVANIVEGAARDLETRARQIQGKDPWKRTMAEQAEVKGLQDRAFKIRSQLSQAAAKGTYDINQILSVMGDTGAVQPQNPVGINSSTQIDTMGGFNVNDVDWGD